MSTMSSIAPGLMAGDTITLSRGLSEDPAPIKFKVIGIDKGVAAVAPSYNYDKHVADGKALSLRLTSLVLGLRGLGEEPEYIELDDDHYLTLLCYVQLMRYTALGLGTNMDDLTLAGVPVYRECPF